jgi:hypothetical protein
MAKNNTANIVGTPGTGMSSVSDLVNAQISMDNNACPRDAMRYAALSPTANAAVVAGLSTLFNPRGTLDDQYKKGIVQTTDLVPMGLEVGETVNTLNLLHHPTGSTVVRTPDWVVLAVPGGPVEWLYSDLKAAGWSVDRVGDCLAPRRAHAAVVEGERAGAAV